MEARMTRNYPNGAKNGNAICRTNKTRYFKCHVVYSYSVITISQVSPYPVPARLPVLLLVLLGLVWVGILLLFLLFG